MHYNFDWDRDKAARNIRKHGIRFERASTVFLDARAISIFDNDHSGTEDRWITMGIDNKGTLLIVCHTFYQESNTICRIRVFSARKATRKETLQYGRD